MNRLRGTNDALQRSEDRARQLLGVAPAAPMFIGISGVELGAPSFELVPEVLRLRTVTNPPGIIQVCRAADLSRADYLSVARYSSGIRAELAAGTLSRENPHSLLEIAWHAIALLKLRGQLNLVCPAHTVVSWDTVAAYKEQTLTFGILDDVPRRIAFRDIPPVSEEDVSWIREQFDVALTLREHATSRRFGLAFSLMYSWNHTADLRAALANVWSGLEALFGDRRDKRVTQALIERMARWLPTVDAGHVRTLYDRRCDALHGRWLEDADLLKSAVESSWLLRDSLIRAIEMRTRTLPDWAP